MTIMITISSAINAIYQEEYSHLINKKSWFSRRRRQWRL